jgi:glucokinase
MRMSSADRVLVGDIGGTNARLAMARVASGRVTLETIRVHSTSGHGSLAELITVYCADTGMRPRGACFALAGPIRDGAGNVTNVGWKVDARELEQSAGLERVLLMNDFAGLANAVPSLGEDELAVVKSGVSQRSEPISVMGAGTGFGVALLAPCGGRYSLVPTEGGHASFPPIDDLELRIWQLLRRKSPHVSVESILSGPGLAALHEALHALDGVERRRTPEQICSRAAEDPTSTSARALTLFCNIFGSVAGNIVLTQGALGGVYLGGGVLMKNSAALFASNFVERFSAKGVMSPYLEQVPIWLIRAEYAALKGAALWFADHA